MSPLGWVAVAALALNALCLGVLLPLGTCRLNALMRAHDQETRMPTHSRCPGPCDTGQRRFSQYLCPDCWGALPADARRALYRRDSDSLFRLHELQAALAAAVPLHEIQISP